MIQRWIIIIKNVLNLFMSFFLIILNNKFILFKFQSFNIQKIEINFMC